MACSLNTWKQMKADFIAGGMSEEEATKEVANMVTPTDIQGKIVDEGTLVSVANNAEDIANRTSAVSSLIKDKTPDEILEMKKTLSGDAWGEIDKQKNFAAWTKLDGPFDKTRINDTEYVAKYLKAGEPRATELIKGSLNWHARNGNVKPTIELVDEMGALSATETKKWLGDDPELEKRYGEYYNDYRNVKPENIVVTSNYGIGTLAWKDGLGDGKQFSVVDGANLVWNPTLNGGKGGYDKDFTAELKQSADYKSATYSFNSVEYAKLLASGELDGKTPEEQTKILVDKGIGDITDNNWWSCVGTMCETEEEEKAGQEGGGGSSGGGSSSRGGSSETAETTQVLYIECNVLNAKILNKDTGTEIGDVNKSITMEQGAYTIQVKAAGYTTRETPITLGSYPLSKTINLTKIPPSISTFINGIGGILKLTKELYLYLYCVYKMRVTSELAWKTFADSVTTVDNNAIPTNISKYDVMYIYHLVNGDVSSAQALVDSGNVTLLPAEEITPVRAI